MCCARLVLLSLLVLFFSNTVVPSPSVIRMKQEFRDDPIHEKENGVSEVKFSFAKHFQDNMVLQRAPKRARIFGYSPKIGEKVIAEMSTPEKQYYYSATVVDGPAPGVGLWVISLDPMKITEPVSFKFMSMSGSLSLKNVLFGDVWLCSGQSNMQFSVTQMLQAANETADAHKYPNIRLMTVTKVQSTTPLYDLKSIDENWTIPSNATVSHGAWSYFSAVCWLYGKHIYETVGYPIGLVATNWGGTPVEAWSSPDALRKCNLAGKQVPANDLNSNSFGNLGGPQVNSVLWNAMIYPFLGTTIYGAIWYQGEADAVPGRMDHYNCTFPSMISDWRLKFSNASDGETSDLFPFGFVQLSANRPDPNITVGFPDIRYHQTADYNYVPNPKMPSTFMAVTMDLPDFKSTYGSIHPRDKEDVGTRLALSGLAVAYNRTVMFQGPLPSKGYLSPPYSLVLDYGQTWKLVVKNLKGFELSCKKNPSVWYQVPVMAHNSTTITLFSNVCDEGSAHALRYAWRESPCAFKDCAVYSTVNNLPGPPFLAFFTGGHDGKVTLAF